MSDTPNNGVPTPPTNIASNTTTNTPTMNASAVVDAFSNPLARLGYGSPSVENGAQYPMTRFTFEYWTLQALYRNSWVVAKVIDCIPDDMLKNGVDFIGLDPQQTKDIERVIRRTKTTAHMLSGMKWGRLFGGAACLIIIDGHEDILEDPLDLEAIELDSYCGLIPFDRWSGIAPLSELVNDPRDPDFGLPKMYQVTTITSETFRIHHSRLLRFTGKTLPNWEKQVEQHWGISEIERIIDDLKKWDNAVGSALGLLMRANIFAIKFKELAQALSGVGMNQQAQLNFFNMLEAQNWAMSNQGMLILPEDGGLDTHSYSFSGIDDVLHLFRDNISGATEIPVSRLFGVSKSGLGSQAGLEGDEGIYNDLIKQRQVREISPILDKLLPIIAMSTLGQIPEDMDHAWPPNWMPTGKERADILKTNIDSIVQVVNSGLVSPRRAVTELRDQSAETGMFASITDEEIHSASDEIQSLGDMMAEAQGDNPNAPKSPSVGSKDAA